jgi:hypothetical protein
MNRLKNIFVLFCLLASIAQAQYLDEGNVPAAVKAKLAAIYPDAADIIWIHDCHVEATYTAESKQTTIKFLCFRAVFQRRGKYVDIRFDSAALCYRDQETTDKPEMPLLVPQRAQDKVAALFPIIPHVNWEYTDDTDISRYSEYEAEYEDTAKHVRAFFDLAWNFLGTSAEIYDSSLMPVPGINSYIARKFKRSSFLSAEIKRDANDNIIVITVWIELIRRRYNGRIITFDIKGNVVGIPRKGIIDTYPGDF